MCIPPSTVATNLRAALLPFTTVCLLIRQYNCRSSWLEKTKSKAKAFPFPRSTTPIAIILRVNVGRFSVARILFQGSNLAALMASAARIFHARMQIKMQSGNTDGVESGHCCAPKTMQAI